MRLLVSGGGTGGHVYPVLTVLQALATNMSDADLGLDVVYVGGEDNIEAELARRSGIPFRSISVGGLRGLSPATAILNGLKLCRGFFQSLSLLISFKPDAIFATGGYVCAPVVAAARAMRRPVLLYLPDVVPGLAVKVLSRLARKVAVSFEESREYLPAQKVIVTGYPVREGFLAADKRAARSRLGLPEGEPVILVLGGSRGAHSINQAVEHSLSSLLEVGCLVHICGENDAEWLCGVREGLPEAQRTRYRVYGYLHEEMADALAAADLAVARAGAATMGEFPAAALPAILIPYPYSGKHQDYNAEFLVQRGAAITLDDAQLRERLWQNVQELVRDRSRLASMSQAARSLFVPDAADRIAREIRALTAT